MGASRAVLDGIVGRLRSLLEPLGGDRLGLPNYRWDPALWTAGHDDLVRALGRHDDAHLLWDQSAFQVVTRNGEAAVDALIADLAGIIIPVLQTRPDALREATATATPHSSVGCGAVGAQVGDARGISSPAWPGRIGGPLFSGLGRALGPGAAVALNSSCAWHVASLWFRPNDLATPPGNFMRQKLRDALRATASTLLEPGERSEATGRARPGHVSVKTSLAIASASAILSGGNWAMYARKKDIYVLLTDRRLIVLEPHWLTFRPTAKVLASMPRPLLVSDVKRGFMTSFVVSATGDANGLQLSFPRTERSDAEAMLTALGAPMA